VSRVEDLRLLTGRGNFTDDTRPEGAAAACFLRSPHAHASITALDITAARAAPGVLAVLLAGDIATNDIARPMPVAGLVVPPWPALADSRVLHVGQPIALVVAETLPQAQDAAELIAIEFATLPAAVEPRAALAPGAAQLWPQAPGNLACDWQGFADPQVAEILASAPHVVHLGLAQSRIAGAPMEPRTATACFRVLQRKLAGEVPRQRPRRTSCRPGSARRRCARRGRGRWRAWTRARPRRGSWRRCS
jgi:carbon-monoxide dehydrogenase large subunit